MVHTCFHAKADHHDQFVDTIEEARNLVTEWSEDGDSHIQIFKLSADEMTDYINLDEELVYLDNTK